MAVDRRTGASNVLATDLPAPTVVAIDGDRLDVAGEGHGNVLAVPRKGGKPSLLVPAPSADWSCHTTKWIHVDSTGLRWLRQNPQDKRGGLFFLPRAMLAAPVEQWRELMAKEPQAGAGGGSDDARGGDQVPGAARP